MLVGFADVMLFEKLFVSAFSADEKGSFELALWLASQYWALCLLR
jgi:hypothetical protein